MASRSRSRSPLNHDDRPLKGGKSSPTLSHVSSTSNNSCDQSVRQPKSSAVGKYFLKLYNVPHSWKWHQVSGYVKKHTNVIDKAIAADITFITMKSDIISGTPGTQDSIIAFQTEYRKNQAYEPLRNTAVRINGKKIFVDKIRTAVSKAGQIQRIKRNVMVPIESVVDFINENYGISADYLEELGISPPLTRKVFVQFLPLHLNDEAKIRKIFGKAGTISTFDMLTKTTHINARIEYDHPVEAVQAVSMFNNREFYGKNLKCEMDNTNSWDDTGVVQGPGLGPDGSPMRGVRVIVEVMKVRDEIMNQCQSLYDSIEELKSHVISLHVATSQAVEKRADTLPNVTNPLADLDTLLTSQIQPIQSLQSNVQQNTGNDLSAIQNCTGSNLGKMVQLVQSNNQVQAGGSMQGSPNIQGGVNMQGGPYIQGGVNMQGGPNIQGGVNMQGGPYIQGGVNMQGGPYIQSGFNMQGGPNMQRGPIMQAVGNIMLGNPNMQAVGNIMLGNPNLQAVGNNMQFGPNMQAVGNILQGGPVMQVFSNMQGGANMQGGPNNIQRGPSNNMAFQHANWSS